MGCFYSLLGLERNQLLVATEEASWLGVPISSIDGNAGGEAHGEGSISVYPVIRKISDGSALDSKNKDGKRIYFIDY